MCCFRWSILWSLNLLSVTWSIKPFIMTLTSSSIVLLLVLSVPATQVSVLSLEYARWPLPMISALVFSLPGIVSPPVCHIAPPLTSLSSLPKSPSVNHQWPHNAAQQTTPNFPGIQHLTHPCGLAGVAHQTWFGRFCSYLWICFLAPLLGPELEGQQLPTGHSPLAVAEA